MKLPPSTRSLHPRKSVLPIIAGLSLLSGAQAQESVSPIAPTFPGLNADPALSSAARGQILLDELHCTACHASELPEFLPRRPAPNLTEVGARVSEEYLERYIATPHTTHPGTRMPDLLGASTAKRTETATAIAQFLVSRGSSPLVSEPGNEEKFEHGKDLFHRVGCVACHGPRDTKFEPESVPTPQTGSIPLAHVSAKYNTASLAHFLFQPRHARPDGRMPDMGLSRIEASQLAHFLIGARPQSASAEGARQPSASEIARGEQQYTTLGCAACHEPERISRKAAAPLKELNASNGCLSKTHQDSPRYVLSADQREALRAAIALEAQEIQATVSDKERIQLTLAAFNCTACHERDGAGGVRQELDSYFGTDEPNLGDHARIPPRLTRAGTKLQPEWMRKVLFDGAAIRPYMHTRMPQFGQENLGPLAELFANVDGVLPFEGKPLKGDPAREARDGARELLGDKGLACIVCHDFNGIPSPSMRGLDLIDTCDRLQPGWFSAFLIDPQAHRPGILMPESWAGGIAAHTTILKGDTDAQIQALWYYLLEGRTARSPDGLRPKPSLLEVTDRTLTYRGRSGIAGFRGIAVGFPGGVNYAFNANNGTLSGLWNGKFIHVRWDGQGAGDFRPAERSIQLAQDVAFSQLDGPDAPWPLRPVIGKEDKTNPDPQYPRNRGYRFRGYSLDELEIPTFRYSMGAVQIQDRCVADSSASRMLLQRDLQFTASQAETVWFRALEGEFETVSAREFKLGKLVLRIPGGATTLIRKTTETEPQQELLLELTLPVGETQLSIEYELLP